jgi:hypothetical protein
LVRSFAEGQEDARLFAIERLHELRQLSYAELRAQASDEAQVEEPSGNSGELSGTSSDYRRRTSIKRFTRSGEKELHIKVQVDDGSRLGRLNPLAEHLIIATPDGEMVGDYTMASEGNDPRRFHFPGES